MGVKASSRWKGRGGDLILGGSLVMLGAVLVAFGIGREISEWIYAGLAAVVLSAAVVLNRGFEMAWGGLKLKLGARELRRAVRSEAKRRGLQDDEIREALATLESKIAHGAELVIAPDGEIFFESEAVEGDHHDHHAAVAEITPAVVARRILDEQARPSCETEREREEREEEMRYLAGEIVPDSGIYDVIDADGGYLGYQQVCVEGRPFPALHGSGLSGSAVDNPRAAAYVLRKKCLHLSADTSLWPHERVRVSGIYNVVDEHGAYLLHQKTFRAGSRFVPLNDARALGYVLHERIVDPPHRAG